LASSACRTPTSPQLPGVERSPGAERGKVAVEAGTKAHLREPIGIGSDECFLCALLLEVAAAWAKGAGDFTEGRLYRKLALRNGDILLDMSEKVLVTRSAPEAITRA
jgi:hypothetical protein